MNNSNIDALHMNLLLSFLIFCLAHFLVRSHRFLRLELIIGMFHHALL